MSDRTEWIYSKLNDKVYVLTGVYALYLSGLSVAGFQTVEVLTDKKVMSNFEVYGIIRYHYLENVDTVNFIANTPWLPNNILLPTRERVLVDILQTNLAFTDEGEFCYSMEDLQSHKDYDINKLYEVADFYGVSRDTIDFWLKDSLGTRH